MVKDAGDDPDVTHGALVVSTVRRGPPGSGLVFRAGEGVGTVTRAGLPLPVGEPATDETYLVDNTAPVLQSFTRQTPARHSPKLRLPPCRRHPASGEPTRHSWWSAPISG